MTPGLLLVLLVLPLLLFPHRVIDQFTSNHKLSHHLLHPVLASLTTETLQESKLVARFSIKKLFLITYHESFKEKNEGLSSVEDSFLLEFSSGHLCVKLLPPRHRRHKDTSSWWCFCEKVLNQGNTHVLGLRRGSTELSLRCVFLPTGCATAPELDSTWDCPIRPTSSQLVSLLSQLVP